MTTFYETFSDPGYFYLATWPFSWIVSVPAESSKQGPCQIHFLHSERKKWHFTIEIQKAHS